MEYRVNPKNGDEISVLAFGCMRFKRDEKETEQQIIKAIEMGVNYFDTAYIYPGSEATLGRILSKGYREKVKIATKLPPYLVKKKEDFDKIFHTQLERLKTDYIDYYLIHMLPNLDVWQRMISLGIEEWIEEKKAKGQIRNIGFSYHGGQEEFVKIVDAYPWEFCMLQYNYYDEYNQASKNGLLYAAEKGLPVMVMEPLRGGKLVNLPKEALQVFDESEVKHSPAEWSFRWLWNHPQILTVLSGMNSQEMLQANVASASQAKADIITDREKELYKRVKDVLNRSFLVPCTGCAYCIPCPHGVDIPMCFTCYNETAVTRKISARFNYIIRTAGHNSSRCVGCGLCEKHCPQSIAIRKELKAVTASLESFPYKPMTSLMNRFMKH